MFFNPKDKIYKLTKLPHASLNISLQGITACLKWKKRFLAGGFPIFLGRWSDQTFF